MPARFRRIRRFALIAVLSLALLALLMLAGLRLAVGHLQREIESALGPRASVGDLQADWRGVELRDLRLRAEAGWPAEDELRARRVRVEPELRSVWRGDWRIARIEVEGAYLSLLRTREGRLRLLPGLLETPTRGAEGQSAATLGWRLQIDRIQLQDSQLAFFDASLRRSGPPHALRVEALQAEVGPLRLPALDSPVAIKLDGRFKSASPRQPDGRLSLAGEFTPATQDARLQARFSEVDLVALQPYLLKVSETGVRRGSLDLDLRAEVKARHLRAPGTLTLRQLELASEGGALSTFAGLPRQAVLSALSREGQLVLRFTLDGRLDDPAFSLNENLATRVASGLAESLGVSVSGVVKGLGSMVKGLFGR